MCVCVCVCVECVWGVFGPVACPPLRQRRGGTRFLTAKEPGRRAPAAWQRCRGRRGIRDRPIPRGPIRRPIPRVCPWTEYEAGGEAFATAATAPSWQLRWACDGVSGAPDSRRRSPAEPGLMDSVRSVKARERRRNACMPRCMPLNKYRGMQYRHAPVVVMTWSATE